MTAQPITMDPSYLLLYVASPTDSAAFYGRLLGLQPVELHPTFALFVLPTGLKLGLWRRDDVSPPVPSSASPGAGELSMVLAGRAAVDACHAQWRGQGIDILQPPTGLDFGYAFTAADPDGHRLRVFAPEREAT